jgi:pimeloyl-ACP methyl ester carboxylesterase
MPIARLDDVEIYYETHGDPDGVPLLLIIGIGNQLTTWPDELCQGFVDREFFVIRFDHRDTGHSTRFDDSEFDLDAELQRMASGEPLRPAYTLSDMAADSVGILDDLGIERSHILGVSMGGMIAQTIVIERRDRVLSLTSMSSNSGAPGVGEPSAEALEALLAPAPEGRDARIEQSVSSRRIWSTPEHFDEDLTRKHFERSWDRGGDSSGGTARHAGAVLAASDRDPDLARLDLPTLVIHGDQDTLVNPSGGLHTAEVIPEAELLMIEGMSHDLPPPYWAQVIEAVTALAVRSASRTDS